jgi:hypothetical protein
MEKKKNHLPLPGIELREQDTEGNIAEQVMLQICL